MIGIEASVKDILLTTRGARVMRPNYGCNMIDFADKRIDGEVLSEIALEIKDSVEANEPRARVKQVKAYRDGARLRIAVVLEDGTEVSV